eukprot:INCI7502.3.p1 GENE.INCI7502.3~~INCI7502.3.p1  ORF type:complete len:1228 (-),score=276.85 INCI7502.3:63-3659(-)
MSQDTDNIFVCCRARPQNRRERAVRATEAIVLRPENNSVEMVEDAKTKPISFDKVFAMDSTQEQVFADVAVPVIDACLAGYNGTIFAYGQTGSGKTYTIMGPSPSSQQSGITSSAPSCSDGLLPRIMHYVFEQLDAIASKKPASAQFSYECNCSYLEIYNEHIYDLAHQSMNCQEGHNIGSKLRSLNLRESAASGVYVEGVYELEVQSAAEALEFVHNGNRVRHVSATKMNRESSRSHSVFSLTVESREVTPDGLTKEKKSKFHLIDLAGSERIKQTKAVGTQVTEAKNINKSLSALGNVIMSLSEVSKSQHKHKRGGTNGRRAGTSSRHVPYRDSKLTFLLRDSLGGNSRTSIIATISTASDCVSETQSTLSFARRAKNVKNRPIINEAVGGTVLELQSEILRLRRELLLAKAHSVPTTTSPHRRRSAAHSLSESTKESQQAESTEQSTDGNAQEPTQTSTSTDTEVSTDTLLLQDAYRLRRQILTELEQEKQKFAAVQNRLQSTKMMLRLRDAQVRDVSSGKDKENSEILHLRNEIELLKKQVQMPPEAVVWRQRHEKAESQLKQCQEAAETISTLEETRNALVSKLEAQFAQSRGLHEQNARQASALQKMNRQAMENEDIMGQLVRHVHHLKQTTFDAVQVREKVDAETAELLAKLRHAQTDNVEMEGQCATMAKQIRQHEAKVQLLHQQNTQALSEKKQFKNALLEAMKSMEIMRATNQRYKVQIQELQQQQVEQAQATNAPVHGAGQLANATRQIQELQHAESARKIEAEVAQESAKITLARVEAELTMRKALLHNAKQEQDKLADRVAQQQVALAAASAKAAAQERELIVARAAVERAVAEAKTNACQATEHEMVEIKAAQARQKQELEDEKAARQQREADWAQRYTTEQERACTAESKYVELKANFEKLKTWRSSLKDAEKKMLQLQEEKRCMARDLEQAYAQSNESTASLANAEKIVAEYKQKTAELSSKVEEMSRWKASIVTAVKEAKTESELKERELAAARAFVDQLQEQVKQQALENRRRSRSSSGSSSGSNGSNENNEPVMAQRAQEKMKRLQLTHEAELHDMKASLQKLQEKFTLEKQRGDKLLAENAKLIGHNNQKQKIKHLEKLAEDKKVLRAHLARMQTERDSLRSENRRLMAEVSKLAPRSENTLSAAVSHPRRNRGSGDSTKSVEATQHQQPQKAVVRMI